MFKHCILFFSLLMSLSSFAQKNAERSQLIWSTYYGGTEGDEIKSITSDTDGNIYVSGNSLSTDLPTNSNSFQQNNAGSSDIFISKFNATGEHVWSTYFGGSNYEINSKIAFTHDNKIVVCGYSNSSDFPTTSGVFQEANAGGYDVCIFKLDTNGALIWSTLFGGNGGELGIDLVIDTNNNILVGGQSNSANFPSTPGALQAIPNGGNDAFIAKFDSNGQRIWATCYGGIGTEDIHAIACDKNNNIIFSGMSNSNDLAISPTAPQTNNNGFFDIYIVKLNSNGQFVWASYFGGTNYDDIYGIGCDSLNHIYFSGRTSSIDFPVTPNAFQEQKNNGTDACFFKFSANGDLLWSTYFGGSQDDYGERIIMDKQNHFIAIVNTQSDSLYTTSNPPYQNNNAGYSDLFLLKFNAYGEPVWSSYFGGSNNEYGYDLCLLNNGGLAFAGSTSSLDLPLSSNPFQSINAGFGDGFIAHLTANYYIEDTLNTNNIINSKTNVKTLNIFPNPIQDKININFPKPIKTANIKIADIYGKICYEEKTELNQSSHTLILPHIATGVYQIVIATDTDSELYYGRFVKIE
jgi:hypothetical protein